MFCVEYRYILQEYILYILDNLQMLYFLYMENDLQIWQDLTMNQVLSSAQTNLKLESFLTAKQNVMLQYKSQG